MSVSIGASLQALSQISSLRSSSATNGAGALDSILQMFSAATSQSAITPPAAPGGSNPISSSNAFDPSTFNALLSIQEQANGGAPHVTDVPGSGSQDGSGGADPTVDTVTNPDGSTTTTLTYPDGTQEVTTTPAVQPVAAAATDMATDAISKNLDQLGDLLGPIATAAIFSL